MAVTWKKIAYADDHPLKATLAAKGSIYVASAAGVVGELAIGADTHILTVATDTPAWAAPGTPGAHAATHKNGGSDEILLHELGEPTAAVAIDGQQLQNAVLHVSAADPTPAVVGKIYFKSGDAYPYVCTSAV